MNSFTQSFHNTNLPISVVWQMNIISEYKGKEALYKHQAPQIIKALLEMALIESVESSNRIEGVTIDRNRLRPLLINNSNPRDRSEEELAGYRRALNLIHRKHASLEINPSTIRELHRLCRYEVGDAGKWKSKDNEIIKRHPNGRVAVIFKPVFARKTARAIEELCLLYKNSMCTDVPPLYIIGCLILDFLCIHPFRDGNGRVSRLLTILALYQQGFDIGQFISLERIIEQSKEEYYTSLNKSSEEWHTAKHNILPWLHFFFSTLITAYKEFEERATHFSPKRGAKSEIIRQTILHQTGDFTLSEIKSVCPGISHDMIRLVFKQLRDEEKIVCLGKGKNARWKVL